MNRLALMVATAGGHIDELHELAGRADGLDHRWVTSRTAQTVSLLAGRSATWVRPVGSRQVWAMLRSVPEAWSILRRHRPDLVMTTGAAIAVPYLVIARLHGIESVYVESATRLVGPSVTGRIAERIPGVQLRTQTESWRRPRWERTPSVFDGYDASERENTQSRSVLVTVGTERFPFERVLDSAMAALEEGAEVAWQTGHTPVRVTLPGLHRQWWPAHQLREAVAAADVVVTHAGVGSVLMALRAGRCPVVVPRLGSLGEHIDDHQVEFARRLADRGLVVLAEPGAALAPLMARAARSSIRRRTAPIRSVR